MDGFNAPIKAAIGSYVAEHGPDNTDPTALKAALRAAILAADPGHRTPAEIEGYAGDANLDGIIRYAMNREASKKELLSSVAPYWPAAETPADEADAALKQEVKDCFRQG